MIAQLVHPFALGVGVFVMLLAAALVVGVLAQRVGIPYTVALVAVGVAVSFNRNAAPFDFGGGLLFFFLPALLFEAAWNLDLEVLRRTWAAILTLAVPGVIVTMLVIAAGMTAFGRLSWEAALVLGAIVSATDPVSVIATFRRLRVPRALQTIVEGESLANDGVAAVLTAGLVAASAGGAHLSLPFLALDTVLTMLGGIAIGIASAFAVSFLLSRSEEAEILTVGTILAAYGSYIVADFAHTSGIFATIAAGIALHELLGRRANAAMHATIDAFWAVVAFLANSLVFLLMGLTMQIDRLIGEPGLLVAAIAAAIVSRSLVAFALPRFGELRAGGLPWRVVIAFAGLRGGLAIALALSLPAAVPNRLAIVDAVFAIVLFTVVVQGLAIGPVVERLRLTEEV